MSALLLKVVLTPGLIVGATLAGRRFGGVVSGWIVGLPLTSAPLAVFLVHERGAAFAARTAVGALSAAAAEGAFCVAYAGVAVRGRAPALAAATAGFCALAALAEALPLSPHLPLPLLAVGAAAVVALVATVRLLPSARPAKPPALPPLRRDLPARAAVATGLVVALTAVAGALGPRLTGVIAVFPLYTAVLTWFAHGSAGRNGAVEVLRGVALGLFAYAGFTFALAALLGRIDAVAAFAAAAATALAAQAVTLLVVRTRA